MNFGKLESPSSVNKLWQVIYDSGELGSAVTSLTISSLNGNIDEEYVLISRIINGYNGTAFITLSTNGDTTVGHYGTQILYGSNATGAASRDTSGTGFGYLGWGDALGEISLSRALIYAKSGYLRTCNHIGVIGINGTSCEQISSWGSNWKNTTDNITSLTLTSDKASGIGVGSRIILLKKVTLTTGIKTGNLNVKGKIINTWQTVYSSTLGAAATSVTISGLTGNTDVLYRLRCRFVNGYNGAAFKEIRCNNDSGANYGEQTLVGSNTSIAAARGTRTLWEYIGYDASLGSISMAEILIYAKSGYIRTALCKSTHSIATTTVQYSRITGYVWNNTTDEITSLVVLSDQANGLGIGTSIELEKLVLS